jgi:hypothetical protein
VPAEYGMVPPNCPNSVANKSKCPNHWYRPSSCWLGKGYDKDHIYSFSYLSRDEKRIYQGMEMTISWLRMNNIVCILDWKEYFEGNKRKDISDFNIKTCYVKDSYFLYEIFWAIN